MCHAIQTAGGDLFDFIEGNIQRAVWVVVDVCVSTGGWRGPWFG